MKKNQAEIEYFEQQKKQHQKSMQYYADAKSIIRKLKSSGVDVSQLEEKINGKHYTLTKDEFEKIKQYAESKI